MDKKKALEALSALAHETRLDVFRSLIQAGAAGLPAGEIAETHDVLQNTMSSHLAILTRAGLIATGNDDDALVAGEGSRVVGSSHALPPLDLASSGSTGRRRPR